MYITLKHLLESLLASLKAWYNYKEKSMVKTLKTLVSSLFCVLCFLEKNESEGWCSDLYYYH